MTLPLPGYLTWEFPTVYISQKLPVAKYLGCNVIVWGILLMLHAVASNFGGFFALRFLLGGPIYIHRFCPTEFSIRHVRVLRFTDPDFDHFHVLQKRRTGMLMLGNYPVFFLSPIAGQADILVLLHGESYS